MAEIGADAELPRRFLALVRERGIDAALYDDLVPLPARYFSETTFGFIREDKPHTVAAALAVGRERVIPDMFRSFLREMHVSEAQAPAFHYYLTRHIHLDEDFHGPLSLSLLESLCGDDPQQDRGGRDRRRGGRVRPHPLLGRGAGGDPCGPGALTPTAPEPPVTDLAPARLSVDGPLPRRPVHPQPGGAGLSLRLGRPLLPRRPRAALFLFSHLAQHYQNLDADPRCAVLAARKG
jgi:hypothetical protein